MIGLVGAGLGVAVLPELALESVRPKGARTVTVEPAIEREIVALTLPDLARVPHGWRPPWTGCPRRLRAERGLPVTRPRQWPGEMQKRFSIYGAGCGGINRAPRGTVRPTAPLPRSAGCGPVP